MGLFDFGNGLFSYISVLTTTYFIEQKLARKTGPTLINDNRQIKIDDYSLSCVPF